MKNEWNQKEVQFTEAESCSSFEWRLIRSKVRSFQISGLLRKFFFFGYKNWSFLGFTESVDNESNGCIGWLQLRIWPSGINIVLKNPALSSQARKSPHDRSWCNLPGKVWAWDMVHIHSLEGQTGTGCEASARCSLLFQSSLTTLSLYGLLSHWY